MGSRPIGADEETGAPGANPSIERDSNFPRRV